MAPTETLIRQHFASLQRWLTDIPVQLILGKGIRVGPDDAPIILGTHALLYDSVQFNDLALVVIDEQQRFGVEQKESLKKLRDVSDCPSGRLIFPAATEAMSSA